MRLFSRLAFIACEGLKSYQRFQRTADRANGMEVNDHMLVVDPLSDDPPFKVDPDWTIEVPPGNALYSCNGEYRFGTDTDMTALWVDGGYDSPDEARAAWCDRYIREKVLE